MACAGKPKGKHRHRRTGSVPARQPTPVEVKGETRRASKLFATSASARNIFDSALDKAADASQKERIFAYAACRES